MRTAAAGRAGALVNRRRSILFHGVCHRTSPRAAAGALLGRAGRARSERVSESVPGCALAAAGAADGRHDDPETRSYLLNVA
jgi:hypothetical protein